MFRVNRRLGESRMAWVIKEAYEYGGFKTSYRQPVYCGCSRISNSFKLQPVLFTTMGAKLWSRAFSPDLMSSFKACFKEIAEGDIGTIWLLSSWQTFRLGIAVAIVTGPLPTIGLIFGAIKGSWGAACITEDGFMANFFVFIAIEVWLVKFSFSPSAWFWPVDIISRPHRLQVDVPQRLTVREKNLSVDKSTLNFLSRKAPMFCCQSIHSPFWSIFRSFLFTIKYCIDACGSGVSSQQMDQPGWSSQEPNVIVVLAIFERLFWWPKCPSLGQTEGFHTQMYPDFAHLSGSTAKESLSLLTSPELL